MKREVLIGVFIFAFLFLASFAAAACIDSDNGLNYYWKGNVTDSYGVHVDTCNSSTLLIEYSCSGATNGNNIANFYYCPAGYSCSNGACAKINYLPSCTAGWKCYSSSYRGYQFANCTWGYLSFCSYGCLSGACLTSNSGTSTPTNGTCSETDNGNDIYNFGTITTSSGAKVSDACYSPSYIFEWYCVKNVSYRTLVPCPAGYSCITPGACKATATSTTLCSVSLIQNLSKYIANGTIATSTTNELSYNVSDWRKSGFILVDSTYSPAEVYWLVVDEGYDSVIGQNRVSIYNKLTGINICKDKKAGENCTLGFGTVLQIVSASDLSRGESIVKLRILTSKSSFNPYVGSWCINSATRYTQDTFCKRTESACSDCSNGACSSTPYDKWCGDGVCSGGIFDGMLTEGQKITISSGSVQYLVSIDWIGSSGVKLRFNDEVTDKLTKGLSYRLSNENGRAIIYIKDILVQDYAGGIKKVHFIMGETNESCPVDCAYNVCEISALTNIAKNITNRQVAYYNYEGEPGNVALIDPSNPDGQLNYVFQRDRSQPKPSYYKNGFVIVSRGYYSSQAYWLDASFKYDSIAKKNLTTIYYASTGAVLCPNLSAGDTCKFDNVSLKLRALTLGNSILGGEAYITLLLNNSGTTLNSFNPFYKSLARKYCQDKTTSYQYDSACRKVNISTCAGGCKDGVCKTTTSTAKCNDTDNGYDIFVRGIVASPMGRVTDSCNLAYGPTGITEYFCNLQGNPAGNTTRCPTGYNCSNGACIKTSTTCNTASCTQTDGGEDILIRGTDTYYQLSLGNCQLKTVTDYCVNSTVLWEYANCISLGKRNCPAGYNCTNGACVPSTPLVCGNGVCNFVTYNNENFENCNADCVKRTLTLNLGQSLKIENNYFLKYAGASVAMGKTSATISLYKPDWTFVNWQSGVVGDKIELGSNSNYGMLSLFIRIRNVSSSNVTLDYSYNYIK